tara:strand:- start:5 stop:433 length:429 start_codon:yes stop_codon:yes gene_type:complete
MAVKISQIRSNISAKVAELTGFKESKHSPDYFGRTENTVAHKAYTVGIGQTTAQEERQRRAIGVYCSSPVRVTFAFRLRPLDIYPTDYDLALDTEETIIRKVLETYSSNNEFTIRYVSSVRQVTTSQEYIIIDIEFIILHTI